ncbi:MAG: hypothetical protein EZS28_019920 [Streblomastix strix]|uniref:Reverse transcriptase domain-containing protein n=1 Tax=Streblomastix strix TaxID=222440 RepID=A0A5J4VPR6_9EUKA|nr:MAG: hypothetical protein EZS28_019920 [Streblomastix strix]
MIRCADGIKVQRGAGQIGQKQKDNRSKEQCQYEGDIQKRVVEGYQGWYQNRGAKFQKILDGGEVNIATQQLHYKIEETKMVRKERLCFKGLPFGQVHSPAIFCKVLRIAINAIREQVGVRLEVRLESFKAQMLDDCQKKFRDLGMELRDNEIGGKSVRQEEERNETVNQKMDIAVDRRIEEKDKRGGVVAGRVEFSAIMMEDASLHCQSISQMKTMALKRGGWMARCIVSKRILGDLVWWEEQVKNNIPRCFARHTPNRTQTTDASETGWGRCSNR